MNTMVSKVHTFALSGCQGIAVSIECFLSAGLPNFDVVGLPDTAVREARERVRAAIKTSGFLFPGQHVVINMAPANTKKEGAAYDLALFLGVLSADEVLPPIPETAAFIGELSLEGKLRPVNGVLPMVLQAQKAGFTSVFVPKENAKEASLAEGLRVYGCAHVREVLSHLSGEQCLQPMPVWKPMAITEQNNGPDFQDVRGQGPVKRALEIAAAGGHNVLMIGPPGAGKSMLARRLASILPALTLEEALETAQIHSAAGLLSEQNPLSLQRPFHAPHYTISAAGLVGGGAIRTRPGEISLCHHGVLFLDEMPEFRRDALESLRQPMEEGQVRITRASGTVSFPARFMLVAAMNPCKCGWFGHPSGKCQCRPESIKQYRQRISGPLLDRIDLHVAVPPVPLRDLSDTTQEESSALVRARVEAARQRQRIRTGQPALCNADLSTPQREAFCTIDEQGLAMIQSAFHRMGMTARSYDRILKVARTIADLEDADNIQAKHLAEALQYRSLDRR